MIYPYDAWGNILTTSGSMASTLGVHNPLRYRGYVYDQETELYYLQSRYYDPQVGRFINADAFTSTGQGLLGNNMFAYCNNNPVINYDPSGCAFTDIYAVCFDDGTRDAPNAKFLMAFYGVDSVSEIPEMPEGAMIFVENTTSVSVYMGVCIVEGKTIVMDAYKYCEYTFVGIGWSESRSMPLDKTITQGYVYGIKNVEDYCGLFVGGSYASPEIYAEITGGMSYAPSMGCSLTYYMTGQSNWIYGPANMVIVTNPYQTPIAPWNPSGDLSM